jgi:PAS domain S-box-containing protein
MSGPAGPPALPVTPLPLRPPQPTALEAGVGHVLEHMPGVAYVESDEPDGRTLYVSPRIESMTGYAPERFTENPEFWYGLIHPEDHDRLRAADAAAERDKRPYRQEYRVLTSDEREVWIRDEAVYVAPDGRRPGHWIGLLVDITGEKDAEARATEAERRYRTLVEELPMVTYIDAPDESLANLYVSPQIDDLLGRASGPTGAQWAERVHPDDRERAYRETIEGIRSGGPFSLEYRMLRDDGRTIWVRDTATTVRDEDGVPLYVLGFFVDVTEQKRLESELRAEAVKFRSLAERIPAVVYIEGPGGSDDAPFYMSPRYEELFGYTPEERQANPTLWRELLHPEDRDRAIEAAQRSYEEGGFSEDYRMIARDGSVVWVHDETVLIRDEAGEPLFWQGVLYDITEQKRAEQELAQALELERRAVERLREADDMKNTFLTAVSHDLRTPLAAILGSAITLENADELGITAEDRRQLTRSLARKARRLTAMVTDLLDMDRLTRGLVQPRREHMDVGALLGRTVAESDVLDERTVHVQAEPLDAWVDESMVVRIVENLLVNATKHTPPTATIWVGARRVENGVILFVEDDGPGIPPDERERLFEPFERGEASAPSPGLGVGLSLVSRFAEAHGGRAWVEDRQGGGASFRVQLPDPVSRVT